MAEDDVSVKFGADTKDAEDGAKRTGDAISDLRERTDGLAEGFKKVGEVIGIAFTIDAIKEFVAGMAELGEQIERTSAMLGVSVERVGELKFIAEMSGSSLEGITLSMERLAFNMERAASGSKTEQDAFDRLGVSWKDATGHAKSLDEMMNEVADSFAKHADGAEKTALAIQLFGRAGAQMIPTLNQGRAELQDLADQARKTGDVLDEATVKGMVETQHQIVTMGTALQGLGAQIFSVFKPAIDSIINAFTQVVEYLSRWISRSFATSDAVRVLALALDVVVAAIDAAIAGFEDLWAISSGIIDSLIDGVKTLGLAFFHALTGQWDEINADVADGWKKVIATWSDAGGEIEKISKDMGDNIQKMFAATLHPPIVGTVVPTGEKSLPAFPGATDLTKLEDIKKALAEVQKTFESVFSSIISGFDRAITGLITRTMTWKQAMFEVLGSIWQEFVKIVEQMLAKWLAAEATKTVATLAGVDARATAEVAGQGVAGASMIANAIKTIFIDAQKTFAGVFGFLSGLMGPFAVGPAAAAGATVAAVAGALPSFAIGAWELPSDMIANVHKGEMIVPAKQAEGLRQGSGGLSGSDIDRLVNKLVPHLKANANASRTMQRNIDQRLRTLRGAT